MLNKKQEKINKCLKLLDKRYRLTYGDPRINIHNTIEHEIAKCKKIYELKKEGYEVLCEAIFITGGRCDILIPETFTVIEILHSEKEKEALTKKNYYPSELNIIFLKSEEI